jgi:hypothetical protein
MSVRKTSEEWSHDSDRIVEDRVGWRDAGISWNKMVTREEFDRLVSDSKSRARRPSAARDRKGAFEQKYTRNGCEYSASFDGGRLVELVNKTTGNLIPPHTESFRRLADGNRGKQFAAA